MLVVDASVLYEVVADTPRAEPLRSQLAEDPELAAPHLIDAEVLATIQTRHRVGDLDKTGAGQAVRDLRRWPGERRSQAGLLDRAWELRHNVRAYDALYVALAEKLGATLVTNDRRLAKASGPRCEIVLGRTSE